VNETRESPDSPIEPSRPSGNSYAAILRILLSIAIAAGLLWFVVRGVDLEEVKSSLVRISVAGFWTGALLYLASYVFRALRFQVMLAPSKIAVGFGRAFSVILSSFAINCVVPAKAGDLYRALDISRRHGGGFFVVLGAIIAERVLDFVAVILFLGLGIAGLLAGGDDVLPGVGYAPVLATLAVIAAMVAFAVLLVANIERVIRFLLPTKYRNKVAGVKSGFLSALTKQLDLILLTLLLWICELASFGVVLRSVGIELGAVRILFSASAATLSNAVPFTPGGLGAFELASKAILEAWSFHAPIVIAGIAAVRLVNYWGLVAAGAIAAAIEAAVPKK
jgi:hypothetical protein